LLAAQEASSIPDPSMHIGLGNYSSTLRRG